MSTNLFSNSTCFNYGMFKENLKTETYLLKLPVSIRISLTKFRVSNHKLPDMKTWNVMREKLVCVMIVLEDKFHLLFHCSILNDERELLLSKYYWSNLSTEKYPLLMCCPSYQRQCKLANFVKIIMSHFKELS